MLRELQRKLFDRGGDRTNDLLHASDIYSCFRRVVLQRRNPVPLSKDAILKFAIGFALQEFFFGPEEEGQEIYGIIMSTDRLINNQVLEFKTTRMSYEKYLKDDKGKLLKHLPKVKFDPEDNESWILRCRAYCAGHNVRKAHIGVFFIYQNDLHVWTVEFSDGDLEAGRQDIEERRVALEEYLLHPGLPPVSTRMGAYECEYCPFKTEYCLKDLKDEFGDENRAEE